MCSFLSLPFFEICDEMPFSEKLQLCYLHCLERFYSILRVPICPLPGVILKMARLVRDGAHCFDGDSVKLAARKPPIRTYLIQGQDFVQIIAKVSFMMSFSFTRVEIHV